MNLSHHLFQQYEVGKGQGRASEQGYDLMREGAKQHYGMEGYFHG